MKDEKYLLTEDEYKAWKEMISSILGIKFVEEDNIIKVKWKHGDKHYIVPLGGLLELWEKNGSHAKRYSYEEQKHE